MFELDLEGTRFEFELENYKKSTKENWDVEWCVVTARVYSDVLKYSLHSSCLLCCEVELLYQKLVELNLTGFTKGHDLAAKFVDTLTGG